MTTTDQSWVILGGLAMGKTHAFAVRVDTEIEGARAMKCKMHRRQDCTAPTCRPTRGKSTALPDYDPTKPIVINLGNVPMFDTAEDDLWSIAEGVLREARRDYGHRSTVEVTAGRMTVVAGRKEETT